MAIFAQLLMSVLLLCVEGISSFLSRFSSRFSSVRLIVRASLKIDYVDAMIRFTECCAIKIVISMMQLIYIMI